MSLYKCVEQISSETSTCGVKFTNKWDGSDVCFLVEEKKVHANRLILSMWSPVFDKMLRLEYGATYLHVMVDNHVSDQCLIH